MENTRRMLSTHDNRLAILRWSAIIPTAHRCAHRIGIDRMVAVNSGAMAIGNFATAALGFVYWWLAAHLFSPSEVGIAAAIIPIVGLIGLLGDGGISTIVAGEALQEKIRGSGFISAAMIAALVLSGICSLIYLAVAKLLDWQVLKFAGTPATAALFAAACALTGLSAIFDSAFIGLLRGSAMMSRNIIFAASKLLFVFIAPLACSSIGGEAAIILSWVLGITASAIFAISYLRISTGELNAPDFALLFGRLHTIVHHHLLNLAAQAPGLCLPFLVAMLLSPDINAAFYPLWLMVNVVLFIPASLSAVLYTISMDQPQAIGPRLKMSLAISALVGLATAIVIYFFSEFLIGLFNRAYPAIAGSSLRFMGFVLLGLIIKCHYVVLSRLNENMLQAAGLLSIGCLLELALAAVGSKAGGLAGLTLGWILALAVESIFMMKPLLGAWTGFAKDDAVPAKPTLIWRMR
jgi:O-antigen/teichoic acid export membrane protein